MKKGATKTDHVISFFEDLDKHLISWFGKEYNDYTVFVFDNARVHVSKRAKKYFDWKKLTVLTVPPYTPEQNPIENVFRTLKLRLKSKQMHSRRLEYVVAETILNMKKG